MDIVTRHAYATEIPDHVGHYAYQRLRTPEAFLNELKVSRRIIDSFPQYYGMEMHITEFNTSYTPLNPIHDTNLNAAYVARLLSEMGNTCASYSYWTFGDVFEESGVSFTPFSGCFGLLLPTGPLSFSVSFLLRQLRERRILSLQRVMMISFKALPENRSRMQWTLMFRWSFPST